MALFKCKMCGGTLEINNNESVATCEYCGTQQTLPKLDDDKRANMYDRANHFRRNNEFDKARVFMSRYSTRIIPMQKHIGLSFFAAMELSMWKILLLTNVSLP